MTRLIIIITSLAAATSVAVAVTASGHTARPAKITTLRVTLRMTSAKRVDAAPKGQSAGDLGVITGELRAPGATTTIGHYVGVCVQATRSISHCTWTLALARGHIVFDGAYGTGFSGETTARSAVLGGTGAYRGALG
jgi:hypothetical protein